MCWSWVRAQILNLLGDGFSQVSNFEIIYLAFPQTVFESEILWIIGIYVEYVWKVIFSRDQKANVDKLIAHFRSKYLENLQGNKPKLKYLPFDVS